MLSLKDLKEIREIINSSIQEIDRSPELSALHQLEARYSLFLLQEIMSCIERFSIPDRLIKLFKKRWDYLMNSDLQYCHDLMNPMNNCAFKIAEKLYKKYRAHPPVLLSLMPSLSKVRARDYTTSSYEEPDTLLAEVLVSDDATRIYHIQDVLNNAQNDSVLKHNSLQQGKPLLLSPTERERLLKRHFLIQATVEAIEDFYHFKMFGNTFGAALNRLAAGLREGGVHGQDEGRGSEINSGQSADFAILEFAMYLDRLDPESKKLLMASGYEDEYTQKTCIDFEKIWKWLNPSLDKIMHSTTTELTYCVEIIAAKIETLLKKKPELFEKVPNDGVIVTNYKDLSTQVTQTIEAVPNRLKEDRQPFIYYAQAGEKRIFNGLISMMAETKTKLLTSKMVALLACVYSEYNKTDMDPTVIKRCKDLLESIASTYPAELINEAKRDMPNLVKLEFAALCKKPSISFFAKNKRKLEETASLQLEEDAERKTKKRPEYKFSFVHGINPFLP